MLVCKRCGHHINNGEQFCKRCGGKEFVNRQPAQQQRPQQFQNTPMQNNGMQNNGRVNPNIKRPNNGMGNQMPQNGMPMQRQNMQMQQNGYGYNQPQMMNNGGYNGQQQNQYGQQPVPVNEDVQKICLTVKDWVITMLMLLVPIWNIIYIVNQIKDGMVPIYKKNFLKAYAIYFGASIVVSIIISAIMMVV